jgi:hypothetical protein
MRLEILQVRNGHGNRYVTEPYEDEIDYTQEGIEFKANGTVSNTNYK